jgi:hypothetical protein
MKKRLSVYLEEGINQMVGDIPRPLFINKIKKLCGEQNQNWH